MSSAHIEGTVIDGRYEVRSRVARGGMATVYRAHDRRLERDVAVKVMHPHLAESETFIARFRREARAAARLSHPNAVAVFDQGLWQDSFYLTMEFVDGEDLRDTLQREGALPVGEALAITEQILDALGSAHRRDLIHRDIKPENVLRASDGTPKLADFGLARAVSDATAASTGTILGTVAYLAPELVTQGNASAASDVYAVGVMLYEMITGRQPYTGDVPINIAFQHVTSTVPPASEQLDGLPRDIDDLISALTAKELSERLPDGDTALAEVRRVLQGLSGESRALRADVAGAVPAVNETSVDGLDQSTEGPNGTAPIWVRPSSGTVALPIGEADPPPPPPAENGASTPRRRRRRALPILLALLITAILGGAAAAYYYVWGPGAVTTVPSIVSMAEEDAIAILENEELVPDIERTYHDTVRAGVVVSIDPSANAEVRKNSTVAVVVSRGMLMLEMPELVGIDVDDARAALDEFPEPEIVEQHSQSVAAGLVISAEILNDVSGPDGESVSAGDEPEAGETYPYSTQIALTVSLGREPIEAPNVVEETLDDARAELEDAGFEVEVLEEREYHDEIPEGSVIEQSHTGDGLYRGDTVTLTISDGPPYVTVPRVTWMSEDDAIAELRDAGLDVNVEYPLGINLGIVQSQSEPSGSSVRKGTVITIRVV